MSRIAKKNSKRLSVQFIYFSVLGPYIIILDSPRLSFVFWLCWVVGAAPSLGSIIISSWTLLLPSQRRLFPLPLPGLDFSIPTSWIFNGYTLKQTHAKAFVHTHTHTNEHGKKKKSHRKEWHKIKTEIFYFLWNTLMLTLNFSKSASR